MMTQREKFKIFFDNACCRKVGRKYVVTCYNYQVSEDRIIASEALTADKAWSDAWQSFKRQIENRLSKEYSDPWLELPDGIMIPNPNADIRWSWEEFRADPKVHHLWFDILKPAQREISLLDMIMQLLVLEVCD